jgi:hypothetical protein
MCTIAGRAARHEKAAILAALIALEGCSSGTNNPVAENLGPGQSSDDAGQAADFDGGNSTIAPSGLDAAGANSSPTPSVDSGSAGPDAASDLDASNRADATDAAEGGAATTGVGEAGTGPPDECSGGTTGAASDSMSAKASVSGYGSVQFQSSTQTQITELRTTLAVPAKPPPSGTLFLWPGLQPLPNGKNYNPIGNGVLQPVLTWGSTCAMGAPDNYTTWWISGQYVNTFSLTASYSGCNGGPGMDVNVDELLDIDMVLSGTVWKQTITDRQTSKTVDFSMDLMNQAQNWAIFDIEADGSEPVSDVIFTATTITRADADAAGCEASTRGQTDYFAAPRISSDGKKCCVSKIILRGQGVTATSPNTP